MSRKSAGMPSGNDSEVDDIDARRKEALELHQYWAAQLDELCEADPFAISTVQRALDHWYGHVNYLSLANSAIKRSRGASDDDDGLQMAADQGKWHSLTLANTLRCVEQLGKVSSAILHEFARTNNLDISVFAVGSETVLNESQRYEVVVRVRLAIKSVLDRKRNKTSNGKRTSSEERNEWICAQPARMSNEDVARKLKVLIAQGADWKPVKHEMVRQIRTKNAKNSKPSQN